jgi:hypothetical protein
MAEDTRALLKLFGVTVTDAEAEAEKLRAASDRLAAADREEVAALLKDACELFRELNARWLDVTQRVFAIQARLQEQLARAAAPPGGGKG